MNRTVLVLGSKPEAPLPDIDPAVIYTANGAIRRASFYRTDGRPPLVCVVARGVAEAEKEVFIGAAPDEVLVRREGRKIAKLMAKRLPEARVSVITEKEQWDFQARLLGGMVLLKGELAFAAGPLDKMRHIVKLARQGWCALGASTGLFTALVAADRHRTMDILLAGIGIEQGGHFYDEVRTVMPHGARARVDALLVRRLPGDIRSRMATTDAPLADAAGIRLWLGGLVRPAAPVES